MTRVLVAAASAVVRAGLEAIVASSPALEVAGTSPTGAPLLLQVEELQPDVVLLEMDDNPVPFLPPVAGDGEPPALVLLTGDTAGSAIAQSLRAGARAVLPREAQPEEIIAAIEGASLGLLVLHLESSDVLLPLLGPGRSSTTDVHEALTPREVEVLRMLAEGEGNKMVARRLGISEHTVKFHVGSILAKLNASSRTEAVTIGVRQGLIML